MGYWKVEFCLEDVLEDINYSNGLVTEHKQWSLERQSSLIEYVLLGFPIDNITAVCKGDLDGFKSLLIVEGKECLSTLIRFVRNDLILTDLKQLRALNGFRFKDLLPNRQRIFLSCCIRVCLLTAVSK